jgi:CheY-like chemotaxis protein
MRHTLGAKAGRVLIAEDEALVALSLADILEAEHDEVDLAFSGDAALMAARQLDDGLAILVTDLNMPGLTGEDLIRALRAERPGLPVVVVTGSPPPGGLEELQRYGGGHGPLVLLHKPVDHKALLKALHRAVCPAFWPYWMSKPQYRATPSGIWPLTDSLINGIQPDTGPVRGAMAEGGDAHTDIDARSAAPQRT